MGWLAVVTLASTDGVSRVQRTAAIALSVTRRCEATNQPRPEEVTRSLLRVTVSKDGVKHDSARRRPSRRRALKERAPPQDEDHGRADMIRTMETPR